MSDTILPGEDAVRKDGGVITFGLEDSYELLFRLSSGSDEASIPHLLTKIEHITSSEPTGTLRLGSGIGL